MIELIFATLGLYIIQLLLPNMLAAARGEVAIDYLVGARDGQPELSDLVLRARRAAVNMQESLLLFLPLAVLAAGSGAAANEAAAVWLGLRVAHLLTYLMGLKHVRTLIWMASLVCLALMAAALTA